MSDCCKLCRDDLRCNLPRTKFNFPFKSLYKDYVNLYSWQAKIGYIP